MEAIGLASGILTFIDVSYKIVRGSYEIYSSTTGATEENVHIAVVIKDLESATNELSSNHQKINDPELIKLSKKCCSLSQDLAKLLRRLQADNKGRFQSFKVAWVVVRKQKEVNSIEKRLDSYRQQIILRLNILLCKEQSPLREYLDEIRRKGISLSNESARKLEDLQNDLSQMLQALQDNSIAAQTTSVKGTDDLPTLVSQSKDNSKRVEELHDKLDRLQIQAVQSTSGSEAIQVPETTNALQRLVSQLSRLESLTESVPKENRVLRRLHFDSIFRREDAVHDPVAETFSWMVSMPTGSATSSDKDETMTLPPLISSRNRHIWPHRKTEEVRRQETSKSFMSYLRFDACTFFIHGKAGSGKSTLMKFLGHHHLVQDELEGWANSRKLVIVRMFFWSSDDPLQKSLEGFYRAILFHTLRQCPELINDVFPNRESDDLPDAARYQQSELEVAFARLIQLNTSDTHRFCYFIDGLDEHEGDNIEDKKLAEQLVSWAQSDNVKIVCSARPDTVFLDVFQPAGITVNFHDLTRSDLFNFASSQFTTALNTPEFAVAQKACFELVEDIVTKAEGVFLWATLVVRSLLNAALAHDYNEQSLRQRLDECPNDLNTLFRKMLEKVDPSASVRRRSNMVLYLAVHNPFDRPLNALLFSWLEDLNYCQDLSSTGFPFNQPEEQYSISEIASRHNKVRRQLHLLTQGLLEMLDVENTVTYFKYRVDFFHRSVRDYLKQEWLANADQPFSSELGVIEAYCRLRSAEAKFVPGAPFFLSQLGKGSDRGGEITAVNQTNMGALFEYTFIWLADCAKKGNFAPLPCIQEFCNIAVSSKVASPDYITSADVNRRLKAFRGQMLVGPERSWRWHSRDVEACSFIHWAVYWSQGTYLRQYLSEQQDLSTVDTMDLNLLLNASLATDAHNVRYLLDRGRRPTDLIRVSPCDSSGKALFSHTDDVPKQLSVTVWTVLLRDFASNVRDFCWKRRVRASWPHYLNLDWMEGLSAVLEVHIQAGADPNVWFLIQTAQKAVATSVPLYRVDLRQMLDTFKPSNQAALEKMLVAKSAWWPRRLQVPWATDPFEGLKKYPVATMDILFGQDWSVYGVTSQRGDGIHGYFKVRVF